MSQGKIVQIIGAVIDVEFPRDAMPKVYDALKVLETGLTLEVQQQWVTAWSVRSPWVAPTVCVAAWQ